MGSLRIFIVTVAFALAFAPAPRGQDATGPDAARAVAFGDRIDAAMARDGNGYGIIQYFALTLDDAAGNTRFDVVLANPAALSFELGLLDDDGTVADYVGGNTELRLRSYVLGPGRHVFSVRVLNTDGPAEPPFVLSFEPVGAWKPGEEREPNRTVKLASPGTVVAGMSGTIGAPDDRDIIALDVDSSLRLWTIEAKDEGAGTLTLLDAAGRAQKAAGRLDPQTTAQMWSLLLPPGRAVFQIDGVPGPWQIVATPAGQVPIDVIGGDAQPRAAGETDEVEPNNGADRALQLKLGSSRAGQIEGGDDEDVYRFTLDAETRLRLSLKGAPDMRLRARTTRGLSYWDAGQISIEPPSDGIAPADGETEAEFLLPQGDYYVSVRGDRRDARPYELAATRLPYFGGGADVEPNGNATTAQPLPATLKLEGTIAAGDYDYFRLPDLDRPSRLTVTADVAPRYLNLAVSQHTMKTYANGPVEHGLAYIAPLEASGDYKTHTIDLPAGKDRLIYLNASGTGRYSVNFAFSDGPVPVMPSGDLALSIETAAPRIAALSREAQSIPVTLTIRNAGSAAIDAGLDLHLSDDRWSIDGAPTRVRVEPGAAAEVKFTVQAPATLFEGEFFVSAQARAGAAAASAEAVVTAVLDVPPVAPHTAWPLPDALLGGVNVAWSALGGAASANRDALIDGYATGGTAVRIDPSDAPEDVTILDLAGDAPVSLKGLIVNPTIGPDLTGQIRRLAIEASSDGTTFTRVFDGEIGARQRENAIVFAAPVQATRLRILPIGPQALDGATASIGEIKAIADASVAAGIAPAGFNIADLRLGGHVIEAHPADLDISPLLGGADSAPLLSFGGTGPRRLDWTIAFRDQRAARIARMEWRDIANLDPAQSVAAVEVETAMDALGPYESAGIWALTRDGGVAQPFTFATPVWARFVRFTPVIPDSTPEMPNVYLMMPAQLSIFEAPPGPDGGTVVGEWGDLSRGGPYERSHPEADVTAMPSGGGGTERSLAKTIVVGTPVGGRVSAGKRVDWWAIDVPPDALSLSLTLKSRDRLGVAAILEDAGGAPVPVGIDRDDGRTRTLVAAVKPGRYLIGIEEPPRSMAVVWDTSGSVGPYVMTIIQSIRGFSRYLKPGQDEASLLPFREPQASPLLDDWTGDPLRAFGALNAYDWADSSSNAEGGVIGGAIALGKRPGTRAILLVTDYASNGSLGQRGQAVDLLKATGAQVFNFAIPSGSVAEMTGVERAIADTFAAFSGGTVTYAGTPADLEDAFARTVARLRAPKDYTMAAEIGFEPPQPGHVSVTVPDNAAPTGGAVAPRDRAVLVIFDASGSMLAKMGKRSRIEIAKDMLNELTQVMLPEGTPFAMRVFGDVKKGSCETNLRVPFAPLDRAAAKAAVDKVRSISGAKTAIGAALSLAANDLAGGKGQKLILLVTDGEETCGGDPEAEIERLRAAGIDARISIIGFAVDDEKLKSQFAGWSAAGGGAYYDAGKPEDLAAAVRRALLPDFDVIAPDGQVIASGQTGGGEVEVPPGTYTIRVKSDPPRDYPGIVVKSGGSASVSFE